MRSTAHEEAIDRMAKRLLKYSFRGTKLTEREARRVATDLWQASRRAYNKGISKP